MEITELIKTSIPFVYSGIVGSKAGKKVINDFSEAIQTDCIAFWEKVKPLFIVEDDSIEEKVVKEYVSDGNASEETTNDIRYILKKIISKDKSSRELLEKLISSSNQRDLGGAESFTISIVGNNNSTIANSNISGSSITIHTPNK